MSLRNSPQLSSQLLAAARCNSQRSRGPRTAAGKQHCKMNALKHGERSDPENHYEVMRALGEDPAKFEALRQGLRESFGLGDALFENHIDDLARLYWRRDRLERAQTGLMRRALQSVEERQRDRRREIAAATFDPCHAAAMDIELGQPTDCCARLRMLLSLLGVLREQARQRVFKPRQWQQLASYYQGEIGWRPARFRRLLWLFTERAKAERQGEQAQHDFVSQFFAGGEAAVETCYQELLTLLEEEIADVQEEFQHEVEAQEERDAIERDACLAPAGEEWKLLLRREETLDRSIDRKVRIILSLRKEYARLGGGGSRTAPMRSSATELRSAPASPLPVESTALSDGESDVGSDQDRTLGPQRSGRVSGSGAFIRPSVTAEGSVADPDAGQSRSAEEADGPKAARDAKIDDRSANVDENTGQRTEASSQRQDGAPSEQGVCDPQVGVTES